MISTQTKLTAVIGLPIKHSLSPLLHNTLYKNEHIDANMQAFENPSVKELVSQIRSLPILLAAVTIPHKQTIIPLLDVIDPAAKIIGAVNTVINKDGKLLGFNTDYIGIEKSLENVELKDKNVLVLGAGGAARPVAYYLSKALAHMYCLNRTHSDAEKLCATFGGKAIDAEELSKIPFDVIINTTSVGMSPHLDASPVPKKIIRRGSVVFDVIYNPLETKLLRDAKEQGAKTISGIAMFVAQGLEQERLWLGRDIEDKAYADLLIRVLQK